MTKSSTPQQIHSKSILKVILSGPLIRVQSNHHTDGNRDAPLLIEERRVLLELLDQRLPPLAGRAGAGAAGRGAGAAGLGAEPAGLLLFTVTFVVLLIVTLVVRPGW